MKIKSVDNCLLNDVPDCYDETKTDFYGLFKHNRRGVFKYIEITFLTL